MNKIISLIALKDSVFAEFLRSVSSLMLRLYLANVFLKAGLVKLDSWKTTLELFQYEYDVPLLPYEVAAYMATAAELTLPIFLIIGLFTPFAALGLFIMSAIIELFIYPGTTEHYYWLLGFAILITHGGGKIAADHWALRWLKTRSEKLQ